MRRPVAGRIREHSSETDMSELMYVTATTMADQSNDNDGGLGVDPSDVTLAAWWEGVCRLSKQARADTRGCRDGSGLEHTKTPSLPSTPPVHPMVLGRSRHLGADAPSAPSP